tara:strand:- start:256 stop:465 length:210 start_codon:yes stop_codon:yes gene_type:complete
MECDLESSLVDWIIEYPQLERLFQELQLEYHCGGRSMEYECLRQGFNPQHILSLVSQAISSSEPHAKGD